MFAAMRCNHTSCNQELLNKKGCYMKCSGFLMQPPPRTPRTLILITTMRVSSRVASRVRIESWDVRAECKSDKGNAREPSSGLAHTYRLGATRWGTWVFLGYMIRVILYVVLCTVCDCSVLGLFNSCFKLEFRIRWENIMKDMFEYNTPACY